MPINIERPRSALLRGVHITEFKGHVINPDPIILQETDLLLEEFLSPTKLKALTGVNDLKKVEYLEMIVDTSETSLGNFGIYLPNLKQLKLNGSHVPRIRDLGTSLVHLRVLWLSRSSLVDLDGIPALNNLKELYLAYNEISDISSCSMLDNLECLDLEGNLIDDVKQIEFLNLCSRLTNLTLYGNPICAKPTPEADENAISYSYRHEIIKILPSLYILDDDLTLNTKPLTPRKELRTENKDGKIYQGNRSNSDINQQCPFDDDWQLINQILDEGIGPPEENLAINESVRPGTSSSQGERLHPSVRPLSAMRPLSSFRIRTTAQDRPRTRSIYTSNSSGLPTASSRLSTGSTRPNTDPVSDINNDASLLTVGPTLQGNPLKSLMARRRGNRAAVDTMSNSSASSGSHLNAASRKPPTYKVIMESLEKNKETSEIQLENRELREEIVKWRHEHAKKLEERKQYFEPQVLKIEDTVDEQQPLFSDSDDDNNNNDNDLNEHYSNAPNSTSVNMSRTTTASTTPLDQILIISQNRPSTPTTRPKTAFKQSFDYDEVAPVTSTTTTMHIADPVLEKTKKALVLEQADRSDRPGGRTDKSRDKEPKATENGERKKRSKSKERHHHHHRRKSGESSRRSPSPSSSMLFQRDQAMSRAATGDTGYSSSASSLSSLRLKSLDAYHHQPIIVSSNSVSLTSTSGSNISQNPLQHANTLKQPASSNGMSSSVSPNGLLHHHQSGLSSLRQLKTNLAPLSGPIKLPSNSNLSK